MADSVVVGWALASMAIFEYIECRGGAPGLRLVSCCVHSAASSCTVFSPFLMVLDRGVTP